MDSINVSKSSGLGLSDKRAATECVEFKECLVDIGAELRWVHSHAQVADGCTKIKKGALKTLNYFLTKGQWQLIYDEEFESARKRAEKGLDILASKTRSSPTTPADAVFDNT